VIVKCRCLCQAVRIKTAIYPTALNNIPGVEIRLTMAYQVNFFAAQFSTILRRKIENYL
jgi:hypothetical protein